MGKQTKMRLWAQSLWDCAVSSESCRKGHACPNSCSSMRWRGQPSWCPRHIPALPARTSFVLPNLLSSCRTDGQEQLFLTEVPSIHANLHIGAHNWKGAVDQRTCVANYPMGAQPSTQLKILIAAELPSAHHGAELLQSKENWWFIAAEFSVFCHHQLEINYSDNLGSQPSTLLNVYLLKGKKHNILFLGWYSWSWCLAVVKSTWNLWEKAKYSLIVVCVTDGNGNFCCWTSGVEYTPTP